LRTRLGPIEHDERPFQIANAWKWTFSFSHAIQQPALELWQGKDANVSRAASPAASRPVQPRRAPWRILGGDGKNSSGVLRDSLVKFFSWGVHPIRLFAAKR